MAENRSKTNPDKTKPKAKKSIQKNAPEKERMRKTKARKCFQNDAPEKEPKRKPKYGMLSCLAYMVRMLWTRERSLVFTAALNVPLELAASALALLTPVILLRYLETSDRFSTIALVIFGLILADMAKSLVRAVTDAKTSLSEYYITLYQSCMLECRRLDRDFFLDYDTDVKKLDERANQAADSNNSRANHFLMECSVMVSIVLKFFLFGSVISSLSPWIILLIAAGCAVNIPLSGWERKRNYETQDKRNALLKKIDYLAYRIGRDFKYGKDIRLYSMKGFLTQLAKRLLGEYHTEREKQEQRITAVELCDFFVVMLRDLAIYAWLILRAVSGELDASRFVLYFTAVSELAEVMTGIRWWWSCISQGALQVSDYRECLEVPDRMNRGPGIPLPKGAFSIEFRDVSYRYPGADKKVLNHVTFRLEAGEKLALVGLNGAGKTTLVRLMCGLLLPTEGTVLIDGHDPLEYNREELYSLFGLVPQNYHLLPFSIARNVTCTDAADEIDERKLAHCLQLAGLKEKIDTLPLGMETPLNRQVNPDGVEFSGGETQKLLLARLLYRAPKCVILDEPTAALDPLAEDRMYRQYNEITAGTTAVFISHRLASTRFCDRIFLLDGAEIAETGTHEELMAAGGKYRELFDVQSKYYKM